MWGVWGRVCVCLLVNTVINDTLTLKMNLYDVPIAKDITP